MAASVVAEEPAHGGAKFSRERGAFFSEAVFAIALLAFHRRSRP